METALLLFILRVVSAGLLVAFMDALFWLVLRDYRRAVIDSAGQRRSYGQLVGMFEVEGKLVKIGQNYPLLPLTSLGRSPTNTVPVEDNFASGEHAVLTRRSDQWWLEDRRSRNGTTLNGITVEKPVIVTDGDVIAIGKMRFRVEFEGESAMTETATIAVIGGSGLYKMPEISDKTTIEVDTPFGKPSAPIVVGTLRGKRVAFLARHGDGHHLNPSEVPYRANIYALKSLGVRFIIAANACGSLKQEYAPGHLVIPDQLYDNTKSDRGGRTFFEKGIVGHVSVADSFSPELTQIILGAAITKVPQATIHHGGTFIIIEGPRFSTRAESEIFRTWGCALIGMTTAPEAFLAREAEIAYASLAHITDYDVWHQSEAPVTTEMVMATMQLNVANVQSVIAASVESLDERADFAAHHALANVVMTAAGWIDPAAKDRLRLLLGDRI